MSKFTDATNTSHTLSIAAMEEASRRGQRTVEVDHLFLALVINEQVAGQVLRDLGITLDSARSAFAEQHNEQLATLASARTPSLMSQSPSPNPAATNGVSRPVTS